MTSPDNGERLILTPKKAEYYYTRSRWTMTTKELDIQVPQDPPLLPPSVRWFSVDQSRWLFEFPPAYQTISVQNGTSTKTQAQVRVPLPWMYYYVAHGNMWIGARTHQIRSMDDMLCHTHLSNIDQNMHACGGYQRQHKKLSPLDEARHHINDFYNALFNCGFYLYMPENRSKLPPQALAQMKDMANGAITNSPLWADVSYYHWLAEQSISDILAWDWVEECSVGDLLGKPHGAEQASMGTFERLKMTLRNHGRAEFLPYGETQWPSDKAALTVVEKPKRVRRAKKEA